MKPLTIEELKVGEWVWVVDIESPKHSSGYWQVHGFAETHIHLNQGAARWVAPKALYGTTWAAYRNKEYAEAEGVIVELPCIRPIKNKIGELFEVIFIQCSGTVSSETYPDKEQAKARLAELKKE